MGTVAQILYFLSVGFHVIALILGFVTLARHGDSFRSSCPKKILTSRTEQKYWTIAFSTIANCIIIVALYPYAVSGIGFLTAAHEFCFSVYHSLAGFVMVLWRGITLSEMDAQAALKQGGENV